MKKYLYIYKTTLIESLQYVSDFFLSFITFALVIWVFLNLWLYIYSDTSNLISGYSINQTIWYVIITELFWFGIRNKNLIGQISDDIKTGTIAYHMNKPYNYLGFALVNHLGKITIKFFVYLLVGIVLGLILVGPLPGFRIEHIPFFLIISFVAIVVDALIRIMFGVLSFWIEDSQPIVWIYEKMILVLGITFPLEMFPLWLQGIIKYSPVLATTYGPAKTFVGYNFDNFIFILIIQLIYIVINVVIIYILYKKGVKRLNANGG